MDIGGTAWHEVKENGKKTFMQIFHIMQCNRTKNEQIKMALNYESIAHNFYNMIWRQ